jgi:hypothetical protein
MAPLLLLMLVVGWWSDSLRAQLLLVVLSVATLAALMYYPALQQRVTHATLLALRGGVVLALLATLLASAGVLALGDRDVRTAALLTCVGVWLFTEWWSKRLAAVVDVVANADGERRRFVFVHGFNNIDEDVAARAQLFEAEVGSWLSVAGKLQAWVGKLSALLYLVDNIFTARIGRIRDKVSAKLRANGSERVRVVAHSRGCYVVTRCLTDMAIGGGGLNHIERVAFLHPDVDRDTFEKLDEEFRRRAVALFDTALDVATTSSAQLEKALGRAGNRSRDISALVAHHRRLAINVKNVEWLKHDAFFNEPHLSVVRQWLQN